MPNNSIKISELLLLSHYYSTTKLTLRLRIFEHIDPNINIYPWALSAGVRCRGTAEVAGK